MTGSEIIELLLQHLDLNPKEFSEKLGFNRPQVIYDIQKGKTKAISNSVAQKIISVFPAINKSWLLTGEGEMVKDNIPIGIKESHRDPVPAYVLDLLMEKDRMMHEKERELLKQNTVLIEQNKTVIELNASLIETLKTEIQDIKKAVVHQESSVGCADARGLSLAK